MTDYHPPRGVSTGFGYRSNASAQAATLSAPAESDDDIIDPSEHSVADVEVWLSAMASEKTEAEANEIARQVYEAEQDGQARTTLLSYLDSHFDLN